MHNLFDDFCIYLRFVSFINFTNKIENSFYFHERYKTNQHIFDHLNQF